jgi:hypothetical protein
MWRMKGRLLSLVPASICFALMAPFGEPRLLAYTALTLVFPLTAIWFSDRFSGVASSLLGVSWSGVSPRNMRLLGWVALATTTAGYLMSLLPELFPVE